MPGFHELAYQLHTFASTFTFDLILKPKITYLLALLLVLYQATFAQMPQQVEDSVNHYLGQLVSAPTNEERITAHQNLQALLKRSLLKPEVYHHPFEKVSQMAILGEPQSELRIWSWHVPLTNASAQYGCVVAQFNEKKEMVSVHALQQDETAEWTEHSTVSTDRWPGALYFKMVPIGKRSPDYYLLFGWEGKDQLSNTKMVDVLHFPSGKPKLGKPIFKRDNKSTNRLIFEYREEAVFSLDYFPDAERIVFSDLGPTHPSLEGKPAHYVPLRSFSGYELQKKYWEFLEAVDFKRGKDDRDNKFIDPEDADMNRQRSNENPLTGE